MRASGAPQYDVFLSFVPGGPRAAKVANKVRNALQHPQFKVFGGNERGVSVRARTAALAEAILDAHVVVALIDDVYWQSEATRWELAAALLPWRRDWANGRRAQPSHLIAAVVDEGGRAQLLRHYPDGSSADWATVLSNPKEIAKLVKSRLGVNGFEHDVEAARAPMRLRDRLGLATSGALLRRMTRNEPVPLPPWDRNTFISVPFNPGRIPQERDDHTEDVWSIDGLLHFDRDGRARALNVVASREAATELGHQYVRRYSDAYPGGVIWIDAHAGSTPEPTQFARAAESLREYWKITEEAASPPDPAERLAAALHAVPSDKAVLYIVDGVHAGGGPTGLGDLRTWCPARDRVELMVTSTSALRVENLPTVFVQPTEQLAPAQPRASARVKEAVAFIAAVCAILGFGAAIATGTLDRLFPSNQSSPSAVVSDAPRTLAPASIVMSTEAPPSSSVGPTVSPAPTTTGALVTPTPVSPPPGTPPPVTPAPTLPPPVAVAWHVGDSFPEPKHFIANKIVVAGGRLWLPKSDGSRLAIVDAANNKTLVPVHLDGRPGPITEARGSVWVTVDRLDQPDQLERVSLATGRTIASRRVGGTPTDLAGGEDAVWIATDTAVTRIFVDSLRSRRFFAVQHPRLVAPSGHKVWVSTSDGEVKQLDTVADSVLNVAVTAKATVRALLVVGTYLIVLHEDGVDVLNDGDGTSLGLHLGTQDAVTAAPGLDGFWWIRGLECESGRCQRSRIEQIAVNQAEMHVAAYVDIDQSPDRAALAYGEGSLWVLLPEAGRILRIDPPDLRPPSPVTPQDGQHIRATSHRVELGWSAIGDADSYYVAVQSCSGPNRDCVDLPPGEVIEPRIAVNVDGVTFGRWRVWSVRADGARGPSSRWFHFRIGT